MRPLPVPNVSAQVTYLTCSEATGEPTRGLLVGLTKRAVQAASNYAAAARDGAVETLDPAAFSVADEVDPHLRNNYSRRMVPSKSVGRDIYDRIRLVSDSCALCGTQKATQLDHYLPKSSYPLLAVAPENLLPACPECNKRKAEYRPGTDRAALLNAYFDDFLDDEWLVATVTESSKALVFSVSPPDSWPPDRAKRLTAHFVNLGLDGIFSFMAAPEIAWLRHLVDDVPPDRRFSLLDSMARSSTRELGRNSWRTATYRALAASDWYMAEGYRQMC